MRLIKAMIITVMSSCALLSFSVQASDYASGHQALEIWDAEAIQNVPVWIKVWLLSLMAVFVASLCFVKNHQEARYLIVGVVLGLLLTKFGLPMLNLTPLSGLVALIHIIFWSPALFLMLKNRPFMQGVSAYAVWSGIATACILFSFVFDIRDSVIYLMHAFS